MSIRTTAAVLLFSGGLASLLSSGYLLFAITSDVNRFLTKADQFSFPRDSYKKQAALFRAYRLLYPPGTRAESYRTCLALGMGLLLAFGMLLILPR